MKKNYQIKRIVLSGMFIALGIVLPFLTGQIPQFGALLSPMHLPVMICGYVCGPICGLIVGFITPLLRSILFIMPPLYPSAIAMAFELATYGFICGAIINKIFKNKYNYLNILVTLIISIIIGKMVFGLATFILLAIKQSAYTFKMFITAAFINSWLGIVIQIVLIPIIVLSLSKGNLLLIKENN